MISDVLPIIAALTVSHSGAGGEGIGTFPAVIIGWVPVYVGMAVVIAGKWLDDRSLNYLLFAAVGMLMYLFVGTCIEASHLAARVEPRDRLIWFFGAFFAGSAALFFYNVFKREAFKRPMDGKMPGEFAGKVFLLDYGTEPGKSGYDYVSLSFAIAVGVGLHGVGEGVAMSHSVRESAAAGLAPAFAIALHKAVEGVGIAAPISKSKFSLGRFVALGAIAGLPVTAGAWLGSVGVSDRVSLGIVAFAAGVILYGLSMLTEMAYMSYRQDIPATRAFMTIAGCFAVFFGLGLVWG